MKKIMAFLVFIVFLICSCISGSHAYAFGHPHFPHHHPKVFPWTHPRFLPSPILKDPIFKPCIGALQKRYKTCMSEITSSYASQHVSISSECCESIDEVEKECASTLFARIKAPLAHLLLKEHCANKGCQPASPPKVGNVEPISPAPRPSFDGPAPTPGVPSSPVTAPGPSIDEPAPTPEVPSLPVPAPGPSYDEEPGEPVYPPMGPDVPGDYDPLAPSPSPESDSPSSD